ncbi:polysaccharide biosynthesis protein [Micromonospora sp. NPDC005174]|uniref:NAD-dependent epimerase/dehydratase family protein n=1 Tax=unclassified Micromonospora TaxID=2617518 RepID=UPI0033AC24B3
MQSALDTLCRMTQVAPPGRTPAGEELDRLRRLTGQLMASQPDSHTELARYLSVQERGIPVPEQEAGAAIRGRRVLVTGGSGCIGTELLRTLAALQPSVLVSAANTPPAHSVPGVRYLHLDVGDRRRTEECLRALRPDVVFHLAAQRDPGRAEEEAALTVYSNVLGTRNVAEAAERAEVPDLVYASTGKALRPWTNDVYAESKRMGEYVLSRVAARGRMRCTGVRFTHVVDNSIVLNRFRSACHLGLPLRLHSAETVFYVQSAKESAQLMLVALAESTHRPNREMRMFMIRDLGWPVSLLDLALGIIEESGSDSPLYVAGYDPGYEQAPYPGLYDPALAGDVSPLINAIEAHEARESLSPAVDMIPVRAANSPAFDAFLAEAERGCATNDDQAVREVFQSAAWALLEATVQTVSPAILHRITGLTAAHRPVMGPNHLRMDDMFRRFAGLAQPVSFS